MAKPRKVPEHLRGVKYIEVTIDSEGVTSVEAHGFNGCGCSDATRGIENALGKVTKRTVKGDGAQQVHVRA